MVTTQGDSVLPKFLDRNGPSGWYSQAWMSRADQSLSSVTPNRCSCARSMGIGLTQRIARADQEPKFEFVVETLGRSHARRVRATLGLPEGPTDRFAAGDDGRAAPVVADGHPLVIWQQRVVGAEEFAHGGRVMDAGVEVGVVTDHAGQGHLRISLRQQAPCQRDLLPAGSTEFDRQHRTQLAACHRSQCHEALQVARRQGLEHRGHVCCPGPFRGGEAQVQHLVADRDTDPPRLVDAGTTEAPERQVLDRKVGGRVVCRLDPTLQCGVVGGIQVHRHALANLSARPAQHSA